MYKLLRHALRNSLRRQLIIGMTLVIASLMTLFVWIMTNHQEAEEKRSHSEQVTALAEIVATSSAQSVGSRDYSGLQEIVDGVSRYPNLRHIILLTLNGQVLAHTDPSKVGLYLTDLPRPQEQTVLLFTSTLAEVSSPIKLAGKQVGWVRVGKSLSHFNDGIAKNRQNGILFTLIGIVLSTLLAALAGRYFTRRLYAIQKVADGVRAGQSDLRVVLPGDDEAATLAHQFNDMLDSMAQQHAALTESELRQRELLKNLNSAIVVHTPDTRIIFNNDSACKILGLSEAQMVGKQAMDPAWHFIDEHGLALNLVDYPVNRVLASGQAFDNVVLGVRIPDQAEPTWVLVGAFPVTAQSGNLSHVVVNFHDITKRKLAEAELIHYKDHLEEVVQARTSDLVIARDAAQAADKAKSSFLASMSHELRTPLNAVLGFSSLMQQDQQLTQEQRKNLEIINRSGTHLLTLINDVLEMAKIESGRTQLNVMPFDLGAMVLDVVDMMGIGAREKGLQLQLDQSSEFPRFIRGDEARLRQILINLVGNAVKFTQRGGVTLRLGSREDAISHLMMEVEDSGPGICAADQQRLFQPFVQLGKLAGDNQGTGLGLSITRQFVQLMGGHISIESTIGEGSVFRVDLPLSEAKEAEIVRAPGSVRGEVVGLAPGQPSYRILIVEDQLENQILLTKLMQRIGLPVEVAENGEVAVQLFQSWRPHLIWMDRRMPVMDGMEATLAIRQLPGGKDVKIVAVTASALLEHRAETMAVGMDDFVRKPYRFNEIFDSLSQQLGVQYIYAEAQGNAAPALQEPLTAGMLAVLPAELRDELRAALESLRGKQIEAAVARVATCDATLHRTLSRLVDNFDYPAVLNALQ